MKTQILSQQNQLPQILITSYAKANEYLLNKTQQKSIQYLISIGDPGDNPPSGFCEIPFRLRVEFHDVDNFSHNFDYILPTSEDIAKVIHFISLIDNWSGKMLVHCHAGISRSTALALIVWAYLLGSGREEQALAYVLAARPLQIPPLTISPFP
jgi:predicted protein tyrosine phosphatase